VHGARCHSEGNRGKPTGVSVLLLNVTIDVATVIQQVALTYPSSGDVLWPQCKPTSFIPLGRQMILPLILSFWPTSPDPVNATLLDRGTLWKPHQKRHKGLRVDMDSSGPIFGAESNPNRAGYQRTPPNKENIPLARFGTTGRSQRRFHTYCRPTKAPNAVILTVQDAVIGRIDLHLTTNFE